MRQVHDIVQGAPAGENGHFVTLSFIQHGNVDDGWHYENICPFCTKTVGYVDDKDDSLTNGDLFKQLQHQMSFHITQCGASGYQINVVQAKRPLDVEKLVKEH